MKTSPALSAIFCSICEQEIDMRRALRIPHDCGCYSHTACHNVESDFQCARCRVGSKAASLRLPYTEVNNYPDFDWVTVDRKDLMARVTSARVALGKWLSIGATHVQDTENPLILMRTKMSLETIMRRRNWCLGDFYFRGVTLDNFVQNGYSLDDLQKVSQDVRERPLATLRRLGLTPDHLVEYNNLLPIEKLQFKPQDIASKMTGGGLGYNPKVKCICSAGSGAKWTVDELLHLGFVFDDLVSIGVNTRERWESLGKISRDQLKKLGARPQDIASLSHEFPSSSEEEEEEDPQPEPKEEVELEELNLALPDATKIQRAANALYLQPKRRFVK